LDLGGVLKNEKNEDWSKFLKEMQEIGPMLKEEMETKKSGIIGATGKLEPINDKINLCDKNGALILDSKKEKARALSRAERRQIERARARRNKLSNDEQAYLKRMVALDKDKVWRKDAKRITALKQQKMSEWFSKELTILLGKKKMERLNKYFLKHGKLPWWRSYIRLAVQHQVVPYPWGADVLAIYVFGKLHNTVKYVWEHK